MNRRSRYTFCYSIDGIFTELPTNLSVLAHTLPEATRLAHAKLTRILKHESRPYWEGEQQADGLIKWQRVTPTLYTGHLYEPGQLVEPRRRKRWTKKCWEQHQAAMAKLYAMAGVKDKEAFASFLSAPILQTIEKAPVFSELFKTLPFDGATAPTIPLRYVVYSRRCPSSAYPSS